MNYPQELLDFWADKDAWREAYDPNMPLVSPGDAEIFSSHLVRLQIVAEQGDDNARYAMATIYLLELTYPDGRTREERFEQDQVKMTQLLCQCAENGMSAAFDNLVTSGVGSIGDEARLAAKNYERDKKPEWDNTMNMPIYTANWMESAMKLWQTQRENQSQQSNR